MARINVGRKSGFIRRDGVMRRETNWFFGTFATTSLAASSASIITSLNAVALALRPFTVVRSRGMLMLESDQTAADERSRVQYGAAVVSDQSVAIGVTAVPTPVTDDGSDLWYIFESIAHSFIAAAGRGPIYSQMTFDSKAMRKVEEGQDIITVAEQGAAVGCILTNYVRTLIKLH